MTNGHTDHATQTVASASATNQRQSAYYSIRQHNYGGLESVNVSERDGRIVVRDVLGVYRY